MNYFAEFEPVSKKNTPIRSIAYNKQDSNPSLDKIKLSFNYGWRDTEVESLENPSKKISFSNTKRETEEIDECPEIVKRAEKVSFIDEKQVSESPDITRSFASFKLTRKKIAASNNIDKTEQKPAKEYQDQINLLSFELKTEKLKVKRLKEAYSDMVGIIYVVILRIQPTPRLPL